jgi:Family of unknown function (DUF5832)
MAAPSTSGLIPVKQEDYLDEDSPLRGQNFVCLSFLSPEDVLANKEVFTFGKFLSSFSKQLDDLFTGIKQNYPENAGAVETLRENYAHMFSGSELQEQYKFYKEVHSESINNEFSEKNDFKTNMRGIKVRGVFDTLKEAQNRADVLKRQGDKFDIFVGQVGCWCPWSPYPGELADQQYAETQLNTLMSKYKENMQQRDAVYMARKDAKVKSARAEFEAASAAAASAAASASVVSSTGSVQVTDLDPVDTAESTTAPGGATEDATVLPVVSASEALASTESEVTK